MRQASILTITLITLLAGCATVDPAKQQAFDSAKLGRYQAAAGSPVRNINVFGSPSWDRIDDSHLLYFLAPKRQYMLTLGGPCMAYAPSSYIVGISSNLGQISAGFDRISMAHGPTCMIQEIRPLDPVKLREGETAAAHSS
ncbi:DUF6491 family protein [Solilutibacter silvestris]|uniref:Lipoprotein n=1 Tax=Solilutibacter silvestris TaxID=1645665 RepID=A0A2K1PXY5_9GAMM|nr:DUF6491 family protein [Lysobacter silvestris]PNS07652.1 hypothetical protein Lysil_1828 [Lysobacter silvestris]